MTRRQRWRQVLDAEASRWSAKPCETLLAELGGSQTYEVEFEGEAFQVEVMMLEDTEEYVHVLVSVDDGVLPAAIVPEAASFICPKPGSCKG